MAQRATGISILDGQQGDSSNTDSGAVDVGKELDRALMPPPPSRPGSRLSQQSSGSLGQKFGVAPHVPTLDA